MSGLKQMDIYRQEDNEDYKLQDMNHKIFAYGISKELIALVERVVDFFIFCDSQLAH